MHADLRTARRNGLLAGLIGAIVMSGVLAWSRLALGTGLPIELGSDRFLPHLPVKLFLLILTILQGPTAAKAVAFFGSFLGQLVFGALIGLVYATIIHREQDEASIRPHPLGISRNALFFLLVVIAVIWLLSLVIFGPRLGESYTGLRPEAATTMTAAFLLIAYVAYALSLIVTYRLLTGPGRPEQLGESAGPEGRRLILTGTAGVVLALGAGVLVRRLFRQGTFSYDGTQALGANLDHLTPNGSFYVVTKNLIDPSVVPQVVPDFWRFEMRGLIDHPDDMNLTEIMALPSVEQETTLACISNGVGGGLLSNAVWKGVPLRTLIERAGPQAGVTSLKLLAVDGYVHSVAFDKAMEPTTILAYAMNGAPLTPHHGFPARLIVPGYYGEGSVKWITRMELVKQEQGGYYEGQGWKDRHVNTLSRIDRPGIGKALSLATAPMIPVGGVAFAGNRGIAQVEVSVDGGKSWQKAALTYQPSHLTWAFWTYDWRPAQPGNYMLSVRATDSTGALQTPQQQSVAPSGATGYHQITVRVVA